MESKIKELEFYRKNAEEDYLSTPISVLRYINQLENMVMKSQVEPCEHEYKTDDTFGTNITACIKCGHIT